MSSKILVFNVNVDDVGATQAVTISIGDTPILRFLPGTRHEDGAFDAAEEVLAEVLRPLIAAELHHQGLRVITDEYERLRDEEQAFLER